MFNKLIRLLILYGGVTINKIFIAGLIEKIALRRDERNNTYKSDEEFIKDKDKILELLACDINLDFYYKYVQNGTIFLQLKKSLFNKYIQSLSSKVCSHPLYKFTVLNDSSILDISGKQKKSNSMIYLNRKNITIFNLEGIENIDKDINSTYYPIKLDTYISDIWISSIEYTGNNPINMLTLLNAYSREYFSDIPLSKILIYSVIE